LGSFQSGKWIIFLSLYFIVFFLTVFSITNVLSDMDGENLAGDLRFEDPGFQTVSKGNTDDYEYNGSIGTDSIDYTKPTKAYSAFKTTIPVITGIQSGNVKIGMPPAFRWIFSFIFFWIPLFMMLWAIYMAIPFFH